MPKPSQMDNEFMALALKVRDEFLLRVLPDEADMVLEIGPREPTVGTAKYHTLDVRPGCTYRADICSPSFFLADNTYDVVIAMEVFEHVLLPSTALQHVRRLLKPGGLLIASSPFNARIHGPLPDLYRFTEHAWKLMLRDWSDVLIEPTETPGRPLMPIQYCVTARCDKDKLVDPATLQWRWIP